MVDRSKIKLMGAAEIGQRLRISRQRTYQLINRRTFPEPIATLAMGQVWLAEDVEAWIGEYRPHLDEEEAP
jgi:prophage regulatory protein